MRGAAVIAAAVPSLPRAPGVYRMVNAKGEVLYVGKARNVKKRVASYAQAGRLNHRLQRMVAEVANLEWVTTHTEVEALLLESNLIKRLKPRYNILLRDDKSFPSILLTGDHRFPQVVKHRGAQSRKGTYFGPFAAAGAVNKTLTALQRAFLLRSCSDSVFAARNRPCLLFQIKRCSAPCVGRIGEDAYAELVGEARAFLSGESQRIQRELARRMEAASAALQFEDAARFRDRIRALTAVQSQQDINLAGLGDVDVVGVHQAGGMTAVQVFFFRGGCNYGNRSFFPNHGSGDDAAAVLEAFLGQFYAERAPPPKLLLSHDPQGRELLAKALSVRAGRRVLLLTPKRGSKQNLIRQAVLNAREALSQRLAESASQRRLLDGLAGLFELDQPPQRIEIYDNSHVSGSEAVAAMVVAGADGFIKNAYRRFTIKNQALAPGDDYGMMREVLSRRFARAQNQDPDRSRSEWPDLVLIDGGAGHLAAAWGVMTELGIDDLTLAAIAKGPDRNAGRERIFLRGREPICLDPRDPLLYYLQRLRDEAHRFAIGSHRNRRSTRLTRSQLDDIPGIGARRKKALLHHFGSLPAVASAGSADLAAVPGISDAMAKKIYDWFHSEG